MATEYKVQWADPKDGKDHVDRKDYGHYGAALRRMSELREAGLFARMFFRRNRKSARRNP